ncbi:MAG: FAD-binding oxidoreductase [Candidatus Koribacter versatilis]|uniref:FAD-binding oxidoreductase n=1 Tax=Candidatus Korobacter versatilis TaxID=658062 RepID=A0A932A8M6_9BACT|nr:FAD-binding oxidoreductase [Candidatus Koribacter versatilis]
MSTAATTASVFDELAAIVGPRNLSDEVAELITFDIQGTQSAIRVSPASAEEVAAILRVVAARGLAVAVSGGFTQQHIGNPPERAEVLLDTSRLVALDHYDPGDLTFGVGAGATVASSEQRLAEHGQFLPLDIAERERATIGGLLATNTSAPLRHGYGGLRDYCIGIHFVTGDGMVAKGGGRVVKNVAGFDLMKLMIGSFGTLGVITGASFKVAPRPRQTATFVCEFASLPEAIGFRDRIMASALTPIRFEIVSPRAMEYVAAHSDARDPDHYHPEAPVAAPDTSWSIVLTAAGSDAVLARYRRELSAARELTGSAEHDFWNGQLDFHANVAARHRNAMLMQLSVPARAVEAALAGAEHAAVEQNAMCAALGRAALGSLTVAVIPLSVDPPSAMQYANAASAIRASLPPDGSAYVLRCPIEAKAHFDVWGSTPTDRSTMLAVKRALDPAEILNRGRFLL